MYKVKFSINQENQSLHYQYMVTRNMFHLRKYTQQHNLRTAFSTNDCRGKLITIY